MHGWLTKSLIPLLVWGACDGVLAQDSEWKTQFEETWQAAIAAEQGRQWANAAALYAKVQELIPGESTTLVARARCLANLGQNEDTFKCLERAVESGWTMEEELRQEEAFAKLRSDGRFARLLKRMAEIRDEPIVVYVPPGHDCTVAAPLIVAFHGRGENPHFFLPSWHEAAKELGFVLVAPRATRTLGNGLLHVWEREGAASSRDIDLAAAQPLLERSLELARQKCSIDEQRIILAGYSQGGAVALGLLANEPSRFAGVFAQASLYAPPDQQAPPVGQLQEPKRACLLYGEFDKLQREGRQAKADLEEAGWNVRLKVISGVGHETPPENTRLQVESIEFLLGRD